MLFLTFVVCFAPYIMYVLIFDLILKFEPNPDVIFICGFLVNLNSLFNPIIYAIWQKSFRTAYCRTLFYCCPKYAQHWYSSNDLAQGEADQQLVVNHLSRLNVSSITNR